MILTLVSEPPVDPALYRHVETFCQRFPGRREIAGALTVTWSVGLISNLMILRGPDRLEATLVRGRLTDLSTASDSALEEDEWMRWFNGVLA